MIAVPANAAGPLFSGNTYLPGCHDAIELKANYESGRVSG